MHTRSAACQIEVAYAISLLQRRLSEIDPDDMFSPDSDGVKDKAVTEMDLEKTVVHGGILCQECDEFDEQKPHERQHQHAGKKLDNLAEMRKQI